MMTMMMRMRMLVEKKNQMRSEIKRREVDIQDEEEEVLLC